MNRFAFAILAILIGCTPTPVAPPGPDASDAAPAPSPTLPPSPPAPLTVCGNACAALAAIGCSEGKAADCVVTLTQAQGVMRESNGNPLSCTDVVVVKTAAQVKALGLGCTP